MKRTLLAAALAATTALTMPMLARAAGDGGIQQAQAAPTSEGGGTQPSGNAGAEPARAAPMGEQGGGEPGGMGHGMHAEGGSGMRGGGPMMRHMMMHGMMGRGDPQERCIDRLAWRAARRAYVEAKLDLTAEQRPLWDKVESTAQAEQQKERQLCRQLKPGEESTVLDRMDRAQQFLSARLDALQAARPAVQALYQALTPDQREVIDHPFRRW